MNQPANVPDSVLRPEEEPILYIMEMVWSGTDSRGVRIQQRRITYGLAPAGWGSFRAAVDFPYTIPHPRNPAATLNRVHTSAVEFEAENVTEAFQKAMPMLVAEMEEFVKKEEKEGFAQMIKAGAARGAHLMTGQTPNGG